MEDASDWVTCRVCGRPYETGCECPGIALGEHTITARPIFISRSTAEAINQGENRYRQLVLGQGPLPGYPVVEG